MEEVPSTVDCLPESLILECLARLPIKDIPIASRVCRKWLHLVGSRHFYSLRKQFGYTNQVACFLQILPTPTLRNLKYVINVFDPMNREWNRLPPTPNFTKGLPWSTFIASSEGKLVVFSDYGPKGRDQMKSMFVFDFATQRWKKGSMPLIISSKFSSVTCQCNRVFIRGNLGQEEGTVWEYDVWKEEWTVLHQVRGGEIIRLMVIGEELWVLIRSGDIKSMRMLKENGADVSHLQTEKWSADVFHLQTEKWRRIEMDFGTMNQLLCPPLLCHRTPFELHELMKLFKNKVNVNVLEKCFRLQLGKQSLIMDAYGGKDLFYMQWQDDNLERMQPPSFLFSGFVGLYCCLEL